MKKITLLFLFLITSWHINAQSTCTQTFTINGQDDGPTVLTINAADITCNGIATPTSIKLVNAAGSLTSGFCSSDASSWYGFDLSVDGGAAITGCAADFNNVVITGFNTLTITSHDDDVFSDFVTITISVEVTFTATTVPNCVALTSPANGAVNVMTSTISWPAATGGATGYKLNVGTSPGATNVLNLFDVGNVLNYDLGTLTAGTTYYVTVVPYNAIGNAVGPCTESSFTTCGAITLPSFENFTTYVPGCWQEADNGDVIAGPATFGTSGWGADGFGNVGTTGAARYNVYTTGTNDWLLTSFYSIPAIGYEIKLNAAATQYANTIAPTTPWEADDYIEILVSTGTSNWTVLYTYNDTNMPSNTGTINIIDLDAYAGQTVRFAFRAVEGTDNGGADIDFSIDDFELRLSPSCAEPLGLLSSNVTSSSADLSWTESGTATLWNLQYGVTGFVLGSGTIVNGVTNPFTLSGLTPATTYQFYVQADCGASSLSPWSGPYSFTTSCVSVTSFTENFDGVSTATFPVCWGKVGADGSAYLQTGTPNSAPNTLYMYGFGVMPVVKTVPVSNLGAGTHRLRFQMRANFTIDGTIEIGYLTDPTDAGTFIVLGSESAGSLTYAQYAFAPPAGVYSDYLAIRHTGNPGNSVLIDDMVWEPVPSVAPGCASNVVATPNATCGNFNTVITWNATPGADGYNLTIGTTTGGTDVLNNVNIGSVTTYSVAGNLNTTYYYTLTPFNGIGSATGCTENTFTTVATGCYCNSVPTSNDALGVTNVQLGATDFPTGDVTYANHSATPVILNQNANANVLITFATGYTYDANIWIDFNNNFVFEGSELVSSFIATDNTNPNTMDTSFIMPLSAALGQHRMRIGTADDGQATPAPCYSGSYGVTLDFTVDIQPELGTDSFDNANFSYYPNPVKNVLNLSYTQNISNVAVYNLLGQQVMAKAINANQSQIDMSHLSRGTYMVKVTADNQIKTIKVIKE